MARLSNVTGDAVPKGCAAVTETILKLVLGKGTRTNEQDTVAISYR